MKNKVIEKPSRQLQNNEFTHETYINSVLSNDDSNIFSKKQKVGARKC